MPKESDGGTVVTSTKSLKASLKSEICELASTMGLSLPLCKDFNGNLNPEDVGVVGFGFTCGLTGCC